MLATFGYIQEQISESPCLKMKERREWEGENDSRWIKPWSELLCKLWVRL